MNSFNLHYRSYKLYLKNLKFKNLKYKPLVSSLKRFGGGRNNNGRITVRHRGGGVKRLYKKICFNYYHLLNFKYSNWIVERVEYDSNRSSNIVLLSTNWSLNEFGLYDIARNTLTRMFNSFYVYILATKNVKKGDLFSFFDKYKKAVPLENEWSKLQYVLTGSKIHNVELKTLNKGKIARSAGTSCKLLRKYNEFGLVIYPSGQKKLLSLRNYVSLGEVSNENHYSKKKYKAGNNRWLGKRPCVRGVAKNPVDHPHGGGNGKTSGGRKSVSPWGKLTKGFVTVRKKKKKLKKKNVKI